MFLLQSDPPAAVVVDEVSAKKFLSWFAELKSQHRQVVEHHGLGFLGFSI
jgi:hypothetical protein